MGYRDRHGCRILLGAMLGRPGGEGTVYADAADPTTCLKIFHKGKAAAREPKLRAMVACPPNDPTRPAHVSLAWPIELVYEDGPDHAFAGYRMPRASDGRPIARFLQPDRRMKFAAWFTWKHLHRVAQNLASAVSAVHAKGHVIGDINENNVLIRTNSLVTLIDTDSFQIHDPGGGQPHRCVVWMDPYLAPELIAKDLRWVDRTEASDNHALGVLLFKLLLNGSHPFDGVVRGGEISQLERVKHGLTPLSSGVRGIDPPPNTPAASILHPAVLDLMVATFVRGRLKPANRATAEAWYQVLRRVETSLVTCTANANHLFFPMATRVCPWCEHARRSELDVFPSGYEWQERELPRDPSKAPIAARFDWFARLVRGRITSVGLPDAANDWLHEVGADWELAPSERKAILAAEVKSGAAPKPSVSASRFPPPPAAAAAPRASTPAPIWKSKVLARAAAVATGILLILLWIVARSSGAPHLPPDLQNDRPVIAQKHDQPPVPPVTRLAISSEYGAKVLPSPDSKTGRWLLGSSIVTIFGEQGSWMHVRTNGGNEGWLERKYVRELAPNDPALVTFNTYRSHPSAATIELTGWLYAERALEHKLVRLEPNQAGKGPKVAVLERDGAVMVVAVPDQLDGRVIGYAPAAKREGQQDSTTLGSATEPDGGAPSLDEIRTAYMSKDLERALILAEKRFRVNGDDDALAIAIRAACKLGHGTKARSLVRNLQATTRASVAQTCGSAGIAIGEDL